MDTTQLLLTVVLTITSLLFTVIGIQLIFILRDVKQSLKKLNQIIEGFESVGVGLEHGLSEIVGFFGGFKTLMKIVDMATRKKNDK